MTSTLKVRPTSWTTIDPPETDLHNKPYLGPSIQLFGYTEDGTTIYVRIALQHTFVIKYPAPPHNMENMKVLYGDGEKFVVRAATIPSTWEPFVIETDPHGVENALWHACKLEPYDWLEITSFIPLPCKYTHCDLNIRCLEENLRQCHELQEPSHVSRLFLWDIEVYTPIHGKFPRASDETDEIFMVSIITVDDEIKEYVIASVPVHLTEQDDDIILLSAKNERDLLAQFFGLYAMFAPDYEGYYNGDMFDLPYVIQRAALHKLTIPHLSKIPSCPPNIITCKYPVPFGNNEAPALQKPGIEVVDLLHYSRRFYPFLPNHRLNTIAQYITGTGKYDLSIDDMMKAVETRNQSALSEVVKYSMADSVCLLDTWESMDIDTVLHEVCNNLRISAHTLLCSDYAEIVRQALWNIAPLQSTPKNPYLPKHLKAMECGTYRNVYVTDYSDLYAHVMQKSTVKAVAELGRRLVGAPPLVIYTAFHLLDYDNMFPYLQNELNNIMTKYSIVAVGPTTLWHFGRLDCDHCTLVNFYPIIMKIDGRPPYNHRPENWNYIALTDHGEFESAGFSEVCRPLCGAAKKTMIMYMNATSIFVPPSPTSFPNKDFILKVKMNENENYTADTLQGKLYRQCPQQYQGTRELHYIQTTSGPLLASKMTPFHKIDYDYYVSRVQTIIDLLKNLPVHTP